MACLDFPPTHHEVMIRRGKHYTSRLIRSDLATSLEAPAALLGDRWYVISGGTGGLGRKVAGWMIERGARHVILLGRRDPSPEVAGELAALSEGDARVAFRRCDVSSFPEVQSVLQEARDELPLGGIIHAAGSLDDTLVRSMTWTQFEHAMSAKCLGAWNLHQATSNDALDLFVLFSSAASLLGSLGQANHCAANAFLDGLARYRRAAGLPAVSINWGAWSEIGRASELGGEASMKSRGIEALSPSDGLTALECVLASNKVQVGVVPVRWSQFRRQFPQAVPPFFSQVLGEGHTDAQRSSAKRDEALIARLREAPVRQRKDILIEYLQQLAASVLRTDAARLRDPRKPLHELGLDSLMGLELQNTIAARLGQNLSATLLINYPTLDALAGYLVDRIVDDRAESGRTEVTDPLPDIASAPPNPKPSRDSEEQPSHGDMLDRIEQMSDEQVESMLQNMTDLRLEPCPAGNSSNGSRNSARRDCAS